MPPTNSSLANLIGQRANTRRLFVRAMAPIKGKSGTQGFATAVESVIRNLDRGVRDGVKGRLAVAIKENAIKNIERGKRKSKYPHPLDALHKKLPPADRLARSIVVIPTGTDTLEMAFGEGARYGRIHNLPKGTFEALRPKKGPFLIFPNRKNILVRKLQTRHYTKKDGTTVVKSKYRMVRVKWLRARIVRKPGTAFFDDAVVTASKQIKQFIKEEAAAASEALNDPAFKISSGGGKIYTGGRKALRTLRNRR